MNTQEKPPVTSITTEDAYVTLLDDTYYRIHNYDSLDSFFMTIVSSSDHWLFISTTGGLSAGRVDSDNALFPYYTVDKLTEASENTGQKTVIWVEAATGQKRWEPFSYRDGGIYEITRNLYKNISGTALIFEEINHDLNLTFRYAWRTSEKYGFVKTTYLINDEKGDCSIRLLDGIQNILPAHVDVDVQNTFSNLLDAYKYSELHLATGLGIYALSSRLTDLAEPSESLRANVLWQTGLDDVTYLLSSTQLDAFRAGKNPTQETYVRAKRGAYFIVKDLVLGAGDTKSWHQVAEVKQDSTQVVALIKMLTDEKDTLYEKVEQDIVESQRYLEQLITQSDGKQVSADNLSTAHHFANVLFNVMRGGIFADHHNIDRADLVRYIGVHHPSMLIDYDSLFEALPETFTVSSLLGMTADIEDTTLNRLLCSYLPLTFSRRHGDPSRPWNQFRINVTNDDGSQRLDYQGNWRDIFQNWEALAYAYPAFIQGMISMFLNATTVDGYNPYRITRDGIDWEVPEPDNPWANIGYWNDHQIIYLEKLLEVCQRFYPQALAGLLNQRIFSYANVPYEIKPYSSLVKNGYKTIDFNWDKEEAIIERVAEIGADGKLVHAVSGEIAHGSLTEKLLLLLLTKLTNFVPEGGIWLNTQRPEWNDANNALVGKGLSVVTLGYMRRTIAFFIDLLNKASVDAFAISEQIVELFSAIQETLNTHASALSGTIDDQTRRAILDGLGMAGSEYRWHFYQHGFSTNTETLSSAQLLDFLKLAQRYIDHTLRANKRNDNLYHAYNILHLGKDTATVRYLYPMLEGQVSILSSGLLSADEALALLSALRESDLYRADQHSYMLYPDRQLAGFLEKNTVSADTLAASQLVATMQSHNDTRLLSQDVNGDYHFHGDVRNADDVARILDTLANEAAYADLVTEERQNILDIFEDVFDHASFTGRSGTFFAFEGLGSIYWHMISKLLLAVQESLVSAKEAGAPQATINALRERYEDIRAGIGFNKSAEVYGAFPTDPYSHTPMGAGAKQPGMTGMVKEEILTRLLEVGITIENSQITYQPVAFRSRELLSEPDTLHYVDLDGDAQTLTVPAGGLAFTLCQVPFIVQKGESTQFAVQYADRVEVIEGAALGTEISNDIFSRLGIVKHVTLTIASDSLS